MRPIPNVILFYPEGTFLYALSTIILSNYTATVGMISGGNDLDLSSTLNVPDDFISIITDYCAKMLIMQRNMPQDQTADGVDNK